MDGGKIFASVICFLLMLACAYGLYGILSLILSGISAGNWIMVIGGGILGYLFAGVLGVGVLAFFVLFIFSLTR